MSGGQYELKRQEDGANKKEKAGLDLNVRLEFDFPLSAKSADSRISECAYPFVLLFHCLHLALLILHCLICGPVRIRRMVLFAVFLINLLFLLCQLWSRRKIKFRYVKKSFLQNKKNGKL